MQVEAYSAQAAAVALGIGKEAVYKYLRDGRLESIEVEGMDIKLVAARCVDAYRNNGEVLKRKSGRKAHSSSLDSLGVEGVTARLKAGETYKAIGVDYGVSRQRVEQWVKQNIPVDQRIRPCRFCGESLSLGGAYHTHYHEACLVEHAKNESYKKTWHQRSNLTEFEALALESYIARGYEVSWAPHLAGFDFLVNGKRVDAKGCGATQANSFMWFVRPYDRGEDLGFDDLTNRCDVYHCIGVDGSNRYDFMWTAEEVGVRQVLSVTAPHLAKITCRNAKFRDRWDLLESEAVRDAPATAGTDARRPSGGAARTGR